MNLNIMKLASHAGNLTYYNYANIMLDALTIKLW